MTAKHLNAHKHDASSAAQQNHTRSHPCHVPKPSSSNHYHGSLHSSRLKVDTKHHTRKRSTASPDHTMLVSHRSQRRQISCKRKISKTHRYPVSNPAQIIDGTRKDVSTNTAPSQPTAICSHTRTHYSKLQSPLRQRLTPPYPGRHIPTLHSQWLITRSHDGCLRLSMSLPILPYMILRLHIRSLGYQQLCCRRLTIRTCQVQRPHVVLNPTQGR